VGLLERLPKKQAQLARKFLQALKPHRVVNPNNRGAEWEILKNRKRAIDVQGVFGLQISLDQSFISLAPTDLEISENYGRLSLR
jgi:hypothetical protein